MTEETHAVIILFGGSGDLARRKLYPAMFGLFRRGQLCQHFSQHLCRHTDRRCHRCDDCHDQGGKAHGQEFDASDGGMGKAGK